MSKTGEWGDKTIVCLHAKDGRRNKKWCKYFMDYADGRCTYKGRKCTDVSHCKQYNPENKPQQSPSTPKKPKSKPQIPTKPHVDPAVKKALTDITLIDICDIVVERIPSRKPERQKMAAAKHYYREHGSFIKPIVVRSQGNKYVLEEGYWYYHLAVELGHKQIYARSGTKESNVLNRMIRKQGAKLQHATYGVVTVLQTDLRHVIIQKENGKQVELGIETCIQNSILTPLVED